MAVLNEKLPVSATSSGTTRDPPSTPPLPVWAHPLAHMAYPYRRRASLYLFGSPFDQGGVSSGHFGQKCVKIPIFDTGLEPQLWPGETSCQT